MALFLLQENPINVGYLKQPADLAPGFPRDRPRLAPLTPTSSPGRFSLALGKAPWGQGPLNVIELYRGAHYLMIMMNKKKAIIKKVLNNKPTERSRNSNFFLEAPIDFSRSPSLPFFPISYRLIN